MMQDKQSKPLSDIKVPWWLSPHGLCLGFLIPMIFLIWGFGSLDSSTFTMRTHVYLDSYYIMLALLVVLICAVSAWMGSKISIGIPSVEAGNVNNALRALGYIAVLAYIYWFKELLFNPINIVHIFTGEGLSRRDIGMTQGITSLVNFTPIFVSIYIYARFIAKLKLSFDVFLLFIAIILLTLLRVFAWAERLAFIEILIPFALLATRQGAFDRFRFVKFFVTAGPFAGLPILVLYFGLAEFFRSWNAPVYAGKTGFWEFALGRIAAYYYTSLNNGAGMLSTLPWPTFEFENVLNWVHKFPVLGGIFTHYVDMKNLSIGLFLSRYGDDEFNNPSGVYSVILDLGLPLGFVYFAITAFIAGLLFRGYLRGHFVSVVLYPAFFIMLLEIFRYPYLGTSRAFTGFIGMIIAYIIVKGDFGNVRKTPETH
ncbi:O-antigen polymerase [Methylobacillus sp. Pita2]|uniref:O-antigen polymerase n=1 Tax=Methylobacillus sp. Pita2 TaxID=3383245 RepID=UPI0038B49732